MPSRGSWQTQSKAMLQGQVWIPSRSISPEVRRYDLASLCRANLQSPQASFEVVRDYLVEERHASTSCKRFRLTGAVEAPSQTFLVHRHYVGAFLTRTPTPRKTSACMVQKKGPSMQS